MGVFYVYFLNLVLCSILHKRKATSVAQDGGQLKTLQLVLRMDRINIKPVFVLLTTTIKNIQIYEIKCKH